MVKNTHIHKAQCKKKKDLKCLLNTKHVNKDVELLRNFPKARRVLIVVRLDLGSRHMWDIIQEANDVFDDENLKLLKAILVKDPTSFCSPFPV